MESLLTYHSTYLYNQMNFTQARTPEKLADRLTGDTIPRSSREILSSFGRRSSSETVARSLRTYGLYGSTAVKQYGSMVVRSMEEESKGSKVVHFAPTRSTPGGSADKSCYRRSCHNLCLYLRLCLPQIRSAEKSKA